MAVPGRQAGKSVTLYFRTQLVKGGAYVPLKIWFAAPIDPLDGSRLDRPATWRAVRNDHEVPIWEVILEFATPYTDPPFVQGEPITKDEYEYLNERNKWAREHDHDDPAARPRDAIDHLSGSTIF